MMNEQNTKFNIAFVIPFKSWLLVKAVQELQIFFHWRNSSKAKKTKTHTPKQSSTECRFAEWSTTIPFTFFVRIFINMVSLFTAVIIHGDQFSIYINSTAFINRRRNTWVGRILEHLGRHWRSREHALIARLVFRFFLLQVTFKINTWRGKENSVILLERWSLHLQFFKYCFGNMVSSAGILELHFPITSLLVLP